MSAGLDFGIDWDKDGGFIGQGALTRVKQQGSNRRLMQFVLSAPNEFLLHDEPIFRDGKLVGRCGSTGYGHTLGGPVSLAWIEAPGIEPDEWFTSGKYEIQTVSGKFSAVASLKPQYDPTSTRIKS